jgi:uncharacterized protein (DUF488 family)
MHEIYRAHLQEPGAQLQLDEAAEIAGRGPSALLCYEADAGGCHRTIVAGLIREKIGCEVVDL